MGGGGAKEDEARSLEDIGTSSAFVMRADALARTRTTSADEMKGKEEECEGEVVVENAPTD